jgi:hypothetical protein
LRFFDRALDFFDRAIGVLGLAYFIQKIPVVYFWIELPFD